MPNIVTHLGTDFTWKAFRQGHNSFTINFVGEDSLPYDISGIPFTAHFRRDQYSEDLFTLTESGQIVNGGAAGTLMIPLSLDNIEDFLPSDYNFWMIDYVVSGKTYALFQGGLQLSVDNPSSTATSLTATVNLAGTSITASITLAGGSGSGDIDGGSASTVYSTGQSVDGGGA